MADNVAKEKKIESFTWHMFANCQSCLFSDLFFWIADCRYLNAVTWQIQFSIEKKTESSYITHGSKVDFFFTFKYFVSVDIVVEEILGAIGNVIHIFIALFWSRHQESCVDVEYLL